MESRDRDKPTLYSPGGFAPIPASDSGTDNFIGFIVDFVTARTRGNISMISSLIPSTPVT